MAEHVVEFLASTKMAWDGIRRVNRMADLTREEKKHARDTLFHNLVRARSKAFHAFTEKAKKFMDDDDFEAVASLGIVLADLVELERMT